MTNQMENNCARFESPDSGGRSEAECGDEEQTSLIRSLREAASRCDNAKVNNEDELPGKLKEQLLLIADRVENFAQGGTTEWQRSLCNSIAGCEIDRVLAYSLRCRFPTANTMFYGQPAPESTFLQHYRTYEEILRDILPAGLREEGRRQRQRDYVNDSFASAAEDWPLYTSYLNDCRNSALERMSHASGILSLDRALGGGLSGLTILAGDPGVGKTTFSIQVSLAALRNDTSLGVVFCSLDMPKEKIYSRLMCHIAGVTYPQLLAQERDQDASHKIQDARNELKQNLLSRLKVRHHYQSRSGDDFSATVEEDIEQLCATAPIRRCLIVMDSRRKIPTASDAESSFDPDSARLSQIELINSWPNCNVFLIAEARKSDDRNRELNLEDLRGSSDLGYAADSVLMMWQNGNGAHGVVPITLRIAKCRDGAYRQDIPLKFDYEHYCFRDDQLVVPTGSVPSTSNIDPLGGLNPRERR